MPNTLKKVRKFLKALWWWSVLRAVGKKAITGNQVHIRIVYKSRYTSPVFWVMALIILPAYIIQGGFLEWFKDMTADSGNHECTGTFKDNISPRKKRYLLWLIIYSNV